MSTRRASGPIPVEYTRASTPPSADAASSIAALHDEASVTSQRTATDPGPASFAASTSRSSRRASSATLAPRLPRPVAMHRPRPLEAPTTSALMDAPSPFSLVPTVALAPTGAAVRDPLLSEGPAPHLARIVAQRSAHALEGAWYLVVHQALGDVGAQLLVADLADQVDERVHPATEVVVGQADHAARAHGRVLVERRLDLGRVDVAAARQDHVRAAVAQVEVAVGIEAPHVAHRLPPVRGAARRRAHVAVRGAGPARRQCEDLAHLARRQIVERL